MRRNLIIFSLYFNEQYTFCNIIITKRMYINNSCGKLWGVMDSFMYIIYDLENRLTVIDSCSHGIYMIFIHEFDTSNTRGLSNK